MKQQTVDIHDHNSEDGPISASTSLSAHEDCTNSTTESNSSSSKEKQENIICQLPPKRSNTICFSLNQFERYGSIYFINKANHFFISKLQKVIVDDNFNDLFEKGKQSNKSYLDQDISTIPDIAFWLQRYYYYSKFDEGIQMDYESWYSVTPEPIAKYIAQITQGKTVIDGFCGSGGNVIQFSKHCKKVYAIDIDEKKIDICKNNCKVYDCDDNIEFITNDYLKLNGTLNADYVFLSPPWGGVKYKDTEVYSISKLMTPNIYDIIRTSLSIAKNIIFYVPRNLKLEELFDIVSSIKNEINPGEGNHLNFDVRILKSNKKIKALLIIFGYSLSSLITTKDLHDYIIKQYDSVTYDNFGFLNSMARQVGLTKFFQNEIFYRNNYFYGNNINYLITFIYDYVLNKQEKFNVKSFNFQALNYKTSSQYYSSHYQYQYQYQQQQQQHYNPKTKYDYSYYPTYGYNYNCNYNHNSSSNYHHNHQPYHNNY